MLLNRIPLSCPRGLRGHSERQTHIKGRKEPPLHEQDHVLHRAVEADTEECPRSLEGKLTEVVILGPYFPFI